MKHRDWSMQVLKHLPLSAPNRQLGLSSNGASFEFRLAQNRVSEMGSSTGRARSEQIRRGFRAFLGVGRNERMAPKARVFAAWVVFLTGSYYLFSFVGPRYVLLGSGHYLWSIAAVPVFILASFLLPLRTLADLKRYPLWANLAGRVGFFLPGVFLLIAGVLAANGALDRTSHSRVVTCLSRRETLGKQRTYYVRVRPWENSTKEIEVDVPKDVYVKSGEGAALQLTTGKGGLGLEWIRRVEISTTTP